MSEITFNFKNISVSDAELNSLQTKIDVCNEQLAKRTGSGSDFLGWLDLPTNTSVQLLQSIQETADELRANYEVVVIIGIGGSYLGAKSVIEALSNPFKKNRTEIIFAGHTLSSHYHQALIDYLQDKNFALVVISKSGTTTEPSIAFRLLKNLLREKFYYDYNKRIVAITDASRGVLFNIAKTERYKTFVIPDDVGGRFSVLTPVGLLPIAIAGFEISELLEGAEFFAEQTETKIDANPIYKYAATRFALYNQGKTMEIMSYFEPRLSFFAEWWKQLFGESEGKNHKGIFPVSACLTTDLHSLGQYIQDGIRNLFETFIILHEQPNSLKINHEHLDADKLNFLAGKTLDFVNLKAYEGTAQAHLDGGVPNLTIELPKIDEHTLGQLIFFYEKAVAMSGYLLEVNPFDQPGVEQYKKNMFALLGKK
ncbi:glucose-6-phosphate isomerase [bacterium]|nr:glucose-6-phosphate isomerase [bacterium]